MKARSISRQFLGLSLLLAALPVDLAAQQTPGAGAAPAQSQQPGNVKPATSPTLSKLTLADFAWLVGRWQGVWGPRVAQQVWAPPQASVMLGTFQLVEGDKTLVLELFTLVEGPNGIEFHIRHFTPALVPWETGGATVLNLSSIDSKSTIFQNQGEGQPRHAVFTQVGPDTYVSRSEINPEKGDAQVTEITYHRQSSGPSPRHDKKAAPQQ